MQITLMASLAQWTPIGFSLSSPYPIPFHKSNYLDLEKIFVKSLPGFSDLRVPTSHFFYTCDGIVFYPTFAKMPYVRKTALIAVDVVEVPGLTLVNFLPCFPYILFPALGASDTVYEIRCFACHGLMYGKVLVCGCYMDILPKRPFLTGVSPFVLALMEPIP